MEAMLVVMTKLQEAGYTEVTEFYKATLTSPDGDTVVVVEATGGVHNLQATCRKEETTEVHDFLNIRTAEHGQNVLFILGLNK